MHNAEQVTFGGAGFDRAAQWRSDDAAIAGFLAVDDALGLAVWRGKPLVDGERGEALVWLPLDHAVLAEAGPAPIFLGLEQGAPRFAFDISKWQPVSENPDKEQEFIDQSEQVHPDAPSGTRFMELRRNMARLSAQDAELAAMAVGVFAWHRSHRFCARCGAASDISMAGWQRSCPSCKAQHFPRTDPVVIMLITHGNQVLVGRSPFWPEGMYSLLAGFMEPGETLEAAVRREVFEESAVLVGQVNYLASQPWPFPSSLMIGCHGQALSHDITIDPKEIEDAKWVSREDMMAAWADPEKGSMAARKGSIANFLINRWLSDTTD